MINPYWFQSAAVQSIFDYYSSGKKGNPVIALPTGTGKSVVIALFIMRVLTQWSRQRFLMLTHVKELIAQNAKRMLEVWPTAPLGIYSAGLKQRDSIPPIVFGGIASVYKKMELFGHRDVLIIDEAHLLSPEETGMYTTAIAALRAINPALIVIGLTATPYRMGQGMITDGGLFTDIIFDMTDLQGFNRLIAEGFLAPLFPKKTSVEYDVSNVGMQKGDYAKGELEKAVDKRDISYRILQEFVYHGQDRHAWLVFASGIDHSEHLAEMLLKEFGVNAAAIHSKIPTEERNNRIAAYKAGEIRCAVNNNVLTTGFDYPAIDYIGHMRPTMSPGLWVQMNGRGTRVSHETGKTDCLALDFAGNTRRLGPINDPKRPQRKGEGAGEMPVRICDECGVYNHASARVCFACGHEFEIRQKLVQTASTEQLIRSDAPEIIWFNVQRVLYNGHVSSKNPNAKPCMKVSYICGLQMFHEWVHLDIGGGVGHEAREWWRQRHRADPPTPATCAPYTTATEAALSVCSQLRAPRRISVWVNRPYPKVMQVEY